MPPTKELSAGFSKKLITFSDRLICGGVRRVCRVFRKKGSFWRLSFRIRYKGHYFFFFGIKVEPFRRRTDCIC